MVGRKSQGKFRARIRELTPRHAGQKRPKAKRCTAQRMKRNQRVQKMVKQVNQYLRDWHGYFQGVRTDWQSHWREFDGYVRKRLRNAISGRYAKGRWHSILCNATLAAIGLESLEQLHARCPPGPLKAPPRMGLTGGSRMR